MMKLAPMKRDELTARPMPFHWSGTYSTMALGVSGAALGSDRTDQFKGHAGAGNGRPPGSGSVQGVMSQRAGVRGGTVGECVFAG